MHRSVIALRWRSRLAGPGWESDTVVMPPAGPLPTQSARRRLAYRERPSSPRLRAAGVQGDGKPPNLRWSPDTAGTAPGRP